MGWLNVLECDRPGCSNTVPASAVSDTGDGEGKLAELPEGWLYVERRALGVPLAATDEYPDSDEKISELILQTYEFCSLLCLAAWAAEEAKRWQDVA